MKLPFTQVDAFADRPFTGNPAAVMPLEAWLPDETLQAIAEENNLSETAFTVPDASGETDYELRWFTPTDEIKLCGHATLASGHVLMTGERIRFRTRQAGVLEIVRDGSRYRLSLPAWKPDPKPLPVVVESLGVEARETLWHPGRYALIVVENEAAVRALAPDLTAMAREGDILTIITAPGDNTDIVSRVFAPGAGVPEDPVTGSAHSVSVPYWAERLGRNSFTAYQASARGGYLQCELAGDRVWLGGGCVTVIQGEMHLPDPS